MKLNLGCGRTKLPGYDNLDIADGREAYPLQDYLTDSCEEVRASHLLEHFPHGLVGKVLIEWVRVLTPGGLLRLSVPDFADIARRYATGEKINAQDFVMGSQRDDNDYHRSLWDEATLRSLMGQIGLTDITRWEGDPQDCSGYPISLNLQGRKRQADEPTGPFHWLSTHAANVYSQHGEDGLLAAILSKLPQTGSSRLAVEIGAADGVFMSNTRALVERCGYRARWYERDERAAKAADESIRAAGLGHAVTIATGEITAANIAEYVATGEQPDVLSIDVDGPDALLWTGLPMGYRPRVVVIEFDPARQDDAMPSAGETWQAGLPAIERLAAAKGYQIVVACGCNAICVRQDMVEHVMDPRYRSGRAAVPTIGQRIAAVMTLPRLGFTDNLFCASESLSPLGIRLMRSCGVFWGQCLTDMIEQAIDAGFEYVLTLDYDTVFSAADVRELYRLMEQHPEADAICALQMKRSCTTPLFTVTNKSGEGVTELDAAEMEQELLEVSTAHFGLTVLRCSAFADIERPWFGARPDQFQSAPAPEGR